MLVGADNDIGILHDSHCLRQYHLAYVFKFAQAGRIRVFIRGRYQDEDLWQQGRARCGAMPTGYHLGMYQSSFMC